MGITTQEQLHENRGGKTPLAVWVKGYGDAPGKQPMDGQIENPQNTKGKAQGNVQHISSQWGLVVNECKAVLEMIQTVFVCM